MDDLHPIGGDIAHGWLRWPSHKYPGTLMLYIHWLGLRLSAGPYQFLGVESRILYALAFTSDNVWSATSVAWEGCFGIGLLFALFWWRFFYVCRVFRFCCSFLPTFRFEVAFIFTETERENVPLSMEWLLRLLARVVQSYELCRGVRESFELFFWELFA